MAENKKVLLSLRNVSVKFNVIDISFIPIYPFICGMVMATEINCTSL